MTATISSVHAAQIERRIAAGERVSKVATEFGLLDHEVELVVEKVRAARAARTPTPPTPSGSEPASTKGLIDPDDYLEHADRKIAKAAAAAHKTLTVLSDLVKAHDDAEQERQRLEKERADAAAAVARLEQQLAQARDQLRAAGGQAKTAKKKPDGMAKKIRAWAAENGLEVHPVGIIPTSIREAYDAAHADQEAS